MEDVCTADGKNRTTIEFPTIRNLWLQITSSQHLQVELANLDSIYTSYKLLILTATQLLMREPTFNRVCHLSTGIPREACYPS